MSKTGTFQLWRVADTTAQARVIEPDGAVVPVPAGQVGVSGAAAPRSGGTLVLAEPSGGWSATLNGTALQSLAPVDGWAQAFRLPSGGGTLTVSHSQLGRDLILALEALAFLVVAALALPGTRAPAESGAAAAAAEPAGRRERGREGSRERREGSRERRDGGRAPGWPGRADDPVPAMAASPAGPAGRRASGADAGQATTVLASAAAAEAAAGAGEAGAAGGRPGSRAVASTGLLGRGTAAGPCPPGVAPGPRPGLRRGAVPPPRARRPEPGGPEPDPGTAGASAGSSAAAARRPAPTRRTRWTAGHGPGPAGPRASRYPGSPGQPTGTPAPAIPARQAAVPGRAERRVPGAAGPAVCG